ncbi:MAG: Pr6Pr family membrane protein [Mycobacteriales bacterium]
MPQRTTSGVLAAVTLWRLLIVTFAFIGFSQYFQGRMVNLAFLTQQGNLATGIVYAGLALYPLFTNGQRHEPRSGWVRGAMCVTMALISVTYLTMMSGSLDHTRDLFSHLLTPILVLIDWLLVGRNQTSSPWWHPLTWPVFSIAYVAFYLAYDPTFHDKYGRDIYDFLNPRDGGFFGRIMEFLLAELLFAYVIWMLAQARKLSAQHPQQPGYYR